MMKTNLHNQEQRSIFAAVAPEAPAPLPREKELRAQIGQTVRLEGMVYRVRQMSGFAFVTLRAGNQLFQCVYEPEQAEFPLSLLEPEASVRLWGLVRQEPRSRAGFELPTAAANRLQGSSFRPSTARIPWPPAGIISSGEK